MRTVIFTCVMLVLFWATDFAVLMWDLNPPGYDGYKRITQRKINYEKF